MALRFGATWALPAYLVLVSALLALSLIDLDTFLLPNKIVYPLAAGRSWSCSVPAAVIDGAGGDFVRALLGGLAAFAFFLTVHLIAPRGMGFGDVKLSFSLGVALGWISWGSVFLGLFLGFLLGAVIGVMLIATKVRSRKRPRAVRPVPRGRDRARDPVRRAPARPLHGELDRTRTAGA